MQGSHQPGKSGKVRECSWSGKVRESQGILLKLTFLLHIFHNVSFCNTIIDKNLLKYVRGSNARYKAALEQKRLAASEEEKQLNARKRAADQIKVLKEKKARLMQDSAAEAHKIDFEIAELERLKK